MTTNPRPAHTTSTSSTAHPLEGHPMPNAALTAIVDNVPLTVPQARAKVAKLRDLAIEEATKAESVQVSADDAAEATRRAQMLTELADSIERRYLHTAGYRPQRCRTQPAGSLDPRQAAADDTTDFEAGSADIGDHDETVCLHPKCNCKASARNYCTSHAKAISKYGHPDGPGARETRPMSLRSIELSAEPLRQLAERRGGVRTMIRNDVSRQVADAMEVRIRRAIERGSLTADAADEIALRGLGQLPDQVWGDEWWQVQDRFWPAADQPQQISLLA